MLNVKYFTFNPFYENTYLLYDDSGDCLVIDPGCYDLHEQQELSAFIATSGLSVRGLVNTHCHVDHVLGNAYVARQYGVGLRIHALEEPVLRAAKVYAPNYGIVGYEECPVESFISPGSTITVGKEELEVLFAPGHAPGHICLFHRRQEICIAGDVLFRESIGRTDLPGGDFRTLIDSIRNQLFTLPDATVVYPGHGPETTIGHEKKYNPFLQPYPRP